MIVLFEKQTNI